MSTRCGYLSETKVPGPVTTDPSSFGGSFSTTSWPHGHALCHRIDSGSLCKPFRSTGLTTPSKALLPLDLTVRDDPACAKIGTGVQPTEAERVGVDLFFVTFRDQHHQFSHELVVYFPAGTLQCGTFFPGGRAYRDRGHHQLTDSHNEHTVCYCCDGIKSGRSGRGMKGYADKRLTIWGSSTAGDCQGGGRNGVESRGRESNPQETDLQSVALTILPPRPG